MVPYLELYSTEDSGKDPRAGQRRTGVDYRAGALINAHLDNAYAQYCTLLRRNTSLTRVRFSGQMLPPMSVVLSMSIFVHHCTHDGTRVTLARADDCKPADAARSPPCI